MDPTTTRPRLGVRAYARWRSERFGKVSHAAVRKAIESGRIAAAYVDGKIDPELADELWRQNTDPAQQRGEAASATAEAKQPRLFADGPQLGPAPKGGEKDAGFSFRQASAIREFWRARMAELDYKERRGELVDAAAVRRAQHDVARRVRDRLAVIESRVAAQLAHLKGDVLAELRAAVSKEVREALVELSGGETR